MINRRNFLKGIIGFSAGGIALLNPTNKVIFDFGRSVITRRPNYILVGSGPGMTHKTLAAALVDVIPGQSIFMAHDHVESHNGDLDFSAGTIDQPISIYGSGCQIKMGDTRGLTGNARIENVRFEFEKRPPAIDVGWLDISAEKGKVVSI